MRNMRDRFRVIASGGQSGKWRLEQFEVTKKMSDRTALRAAACGRAREFVPPGTYHQLVRGQQIVMSTTRAEIDDHMPVLSALEDCDNGNVLITGLGLGMVLTAVLDTPGVDHVTVIEISEDVIGLVEPAYRAAGYDEDRLTIVHADALEWKPPKGARYAVAWHDIWDLISSDNLRSMHRLHRKYGRCTDWQGSWCRYECEKRRREWLRRSH